MFRLKNSKICLEFIYGSEINLPYTKGTFLRKETQVLKVHCESKEYTAWSDTAFCVV